MADFDIQDKVAGGRSVMLNKSGSTLSDANATILRNIANMKTYLLANGYTALTLNKMTKNDLDYACRLSLGLV